MQVREKKNNYLANNQSFSFKEKLSNGVQINTYIVLESEKFLEYQKDLLNDFLADFVDKANTEVYDEGDLKANLEEGLQSLNVKLKLFADKVSDIDHFGLKGYIQIIAGNMLMASMIGNTSIVIFRDKKLYYQLHNSVSKKSSIDTFSDFVEGDIESGDEVIYVGTNFSDVLDQSDIKEIEDILKSDETSLSSFLEKTFTNRIEKEKISMMSTYYIHGNIGTNTNIEKKSSKKTLRIKSGWTKKVVTNKYYMTIIILGIVILFMLYNVLSQLLNTSNQNIFTTSSGTVVDITIEDIKKDIYMFQQMDPTSDQKGLKYQEIAEKLSLLEEKGRWLEDVEQLKGIIQDDYYKGFNIIRLEKLSQLDDPSTGIKTRNILLNNTEQEKLGEGLFITYNNGISIGGDQGALIGAINDGSRGSLIEYDIDEEINGCSTNLLRNGLYCHTENGRIFSVTKAGIEPVTTSDVGGFPDTVGGVGVYGKANMYVFQPNLSSSLSGVFVTRYRNTVGSQTVYQEGQNYSLTPGYSSGIDLSSSDFSSFAIDSTFLTRNDNKLYQLRRPGYGSLLDVREVQLMGGDQVKNKYSNNVKVITYLNSKYVYLFDKDNKKFSVYTSKPLKTNDQYNTQYTLYYLFSFQFDLTEEEVIDVAIPEDTGNRPELYILTDKGVNKVNLYEYIDSIVNDETLKRVTSNSL